MANSMLRLTLSIFVSAILGAVQSLVGKMPTNLVAWNAAKSTQGSFRNRDVVKAFDGEKAVGELTS